MSKDPVAWFSKLPDGRLSIKIVGKPTEGNWEPLYTHPSAEQREVDCAVFASLLERELVAEKEWVRQLTNSNVRLKKFLVEAQAEIARLKGEAESWEQVFDKTCEHLANAKTELDESKSNYMDLIMSVENAYPNETRHQTALRYIRERENMPRHGVSDAANDLREMEAKKND
jgi:hypothetical protein